MQGSGEIQETALFPGENRKSGETDCIRYPQALCAGRYGRKKGYGTGESETGKAGGSAFRGNASLRRG